jgi:DNA-binding IclR family transcriptional regulator
MASLRSATSETVNLALLSRGRIRYSAIIDGAFALRMLTKVGDEVPPHATAIGKAMAAFLPPTEREALLGAEPYPALTDQTITSGTKLEAELNRVRTDGFATDNGEVEVGAACVAAPIFGSDGRPLAAISVSGLAERMANSGVPELGRIIRGWCDDISQQLGYGDLGRRAGR